MPTVKRVATYVPKGGVGKTTSSGHVAVAAAQEYDQDVLALDLAGTQNDLATQFGFEEIAEQVDVPLSAVFGDQWDFITSEIDDVLGRMVFETDEGVDLIPADPGLGGADNNLANVPLDTRFELLEAFIANHVAPDYDLVVIDLPGKEDNIALNGLFAAQDVVAPLRPGAFESNQLDSLEAELKRIRDNDDHDAAPRLAMVIPTMIDRTTNLAESFVTELEEVYPERTTTTVADTANISTAQSEGHTLFASEDDELYPTGKRARAAYRSLTGDLLERLEDY